MSAEIIVSAPSLIRAETVAPLLIANVGIYAGVGRLAGYDGLQWREMRSFAGFQVREGWMSTSSREFIKSLEQSYREERTLQEAWNHRNRMLAIMSYGLFPHRTDSLKGLLQIQSHLGRKPTTVYPAIGNFELEKEDQHRLADKMIQLTNSLAIACEALSLEDLVNYVVYSYEDPSGYSIALDLSHYFNITKFNLPSIDKALDIMYPHIKEVHYSANRLEMNPNDVNTQLAYLDLLNDTEYSDSTKMLKALLERGFSGTLVTEVPAFSIKGPLFSTHKKLADRLHELVAKI